MTNSILLPRASAPFAFVLALVGCGAPDPEPTSPGPPAATELVQVTTYTSYADHGTDSVEYVPAAELAERDPDGFGQARQALGYSHGAWTDNEVYYYDVVYPNSSGSFNWANIPMNQARNYLNDASLITGIVLSETPFPNSNPRDGRVRVVTGVTAACDASPLTGCELGVAAVTRANGKILYTDITIWLGNIDRYYGPSQARALAVRKTMIHEVGHGLGLQHFTGGAAAPLCNSPTGSGTTCAWGSKPGGQDSVMSYCSPVTVNGFDGCELEELYWNVSPGPEL